MSVPPEVLRHLKNKIQEGERLEEKYFDHQTQFSHNYHKFQEKIGLWVSLVFNLYEEKISSSYTTNHYQIISYLLPLLSRTSPSHYHESSLDGDEVVTALHRELTYELRYPGTIRPVMGYTPLFLYNCIYFNLQQKIKREEMFDFMYPLWSSNHMTVLYFHPTATGWEISHINTGAYSETEHQDENYSYQTPYPTIHLSDHHSAYRFVQRLEPFIYYQIHSDNWYDQNVDKHHTSYRTFLWNHGLSNGEIAQPITMYHLIHTLNLEIPSDIHPHLKKVLQALKSHPPDEWKSPEKSNPEPVVFEDTGSGSSSLDWKTKPLWYPEFVPEIYRAPLNIRKLFQELSNSKKDVMYKLFNQHVFSSGSMIPGSPISLRSPAWLTSTYSVLAQEWERAREQNQAQIETGAPITYPEVELSDPSPGEERKEEPLNEGIHHRVHQRAMSQIHFFRHGESGRILINKQRAGSCVYRSMLNGFLHGMVMQVHEKATDKHHQIKIFQAWIRYFQAYLSDLLKQIYQPFLRHYRLQSYENCNNHHVVHLMIQDGIIDPQWHIQLQYYDFSPSIHLKMKNPSLDWMELPPSLPLDQIEDLTTSLRKKEGDWKTFQNYLESIYPSKLPTYTSNLIRAEFLTLYFLGRYYLVPDVFQGGKLRVDNYGLRYAWNSGRIHLAPDEELAIHQQIREWFIKYGERSPFSMGQLGSDFIYEFMVKWKELPPSEYKKFSTEYYSYLSNYQKRYDSTNDSYLTDREDIWWDCVKNKNFRSEAQNKGYLKRSFSVPDNLKRYEPEDRVKIRKILNEYSGDFWKPIEFTGRETIVWFKILDEIGYHEYNCSAMLKVAKSVAFTHQSTLDLDAWEKTHPLVNKIVGWSSERLSEYYQYRNRVLTGETYQWILTGTPPPRRESNIPDNQRHLHRYHESNLQFEEMILLLLEDPNNYLEKVGNYMDSFNSKNYLQLIDELLEGLIRLLIKTQFKNPVEASRVLAQGVKAMVSAYYRRQSKIRRVPSLPEFLQVLSFLNKQFWLQSKDIYTWMINAGTFNSIHESHDTLLLEAFLPDSKMPLLSVDTQQIFEFLIQEEVHLKSAEEIVDLLPRLDFWERRRRVNHPDVENLSMGVRYQGLDYQPCQPYFNSSLLQLPQKLFHLLSQIDLKVTWFLHSDSDPSTDAQLMAILNQELFLAPGGTVSHDQLLQINLGSLKLEEMIDEWEDFKLVKYQVVEYQIQELFWNGQRVDTEIWTRNSRDLRAPLKQYPFLINLPATTLNLFTPKSEQAHILQLNPYYGTRTRNAFGGLFYPPQLSSLLTISPSANMLTPRLSSSKYQLLDKLRQQHHQAYPYHYPPQQYLQEMSEAEKSKIIHSPKADLYIYGASSSEVESTSVDALYQELNEAISKLINPEVSLTQYRSTQPVADISQMPLAEKEKTPVYDNRILQDLAPEEQTRTFLSFLKKHPNCYLKCQLTTSEQESLKTYISDAQTKLSERRQQLMAEIEYPTLTAPSNLCEVIVGGDNYGRWIQILQINLYLKKIQRLSEIFGPCQPLNCYEIMEINQLIQLEPLAHDHQDRLQVTDLITEFLSGLIFKKEQWVKYLEMRTNLESKLADPSTLQQIHHFMMGKGKSSVLSPLLAVYLATQCDSVEQVITVVPEHLVSQTYETMERYLHPLHQPIIVKPDHQLKLEFLQDPERYTSYEKTAFLVDEVDFLLNPYQSNFNMVIEDKNRFEEAELNSLWDFVYRYLPTTDLGEEEQDEYLEQRRMELEAHNLAQESEEGKEGEGGDSKDDDELEETKEGPREGEGGEDDEDDDGDKEDDEEDDEDEFKARDRMGQLNSHQLRASKFTLQDEVKSTLLNERFIRGVTFGMSREKFDAKHRLCIPYARGDTPMESSRFKSPVTTIVLTIKYFFDLQYILEEPDLPLLKNLLDAWELCLDHLPEAQRLKGEDQFEKVREQYHQIDYRVRLEIFHKYLFYLVKQMRLSSLIQNCSMNDMMMIKNQWKVGYTGTVNVHTEYLPEMGYQSEIIHDWDETYGVYFSLMGAHPNAPNQFHHLPYLPPLTTTSDRENVHQVLWTLLQTIDPDSKQYRFSALVDAAAYLKDYSNLQVAQKLGAVMPTRRIIFLTPEDQKLIWYRGRVTAYQNEIYQAQEVFYYYDNRHTVGTDILQPNIMRGLILINDQNSYTEISQAIYRLRKLVRGHSMDIGYVGQLIPRVRDPRLSLEERKIWTEETRKFTLYQQLVEHDRRFLEGSQPLNLLQVLKAYYRSLQNQTLIKFPSAGAGGDSWEIRSGQIYQETDLRSLYQYEEVKRGDINQAIQNHAQSNIWPRMRQLSSISETPEYHRFQELQKIFNDLSQDIKTTILFGTETKEQENQSEVTSEKEAEHDVNRITENQKIRQWQSFQRSFEHIYLSWYRTDGSQVAFTLAIKEHRLKVSWNIFNHACGHLILVHENFDQATSSPTPPRTFLLTNLNHLPQYRDYPVYSDQGHLLNELTHKDGQLELAFPGYRPLSLLELATCLGANLRVPGGQINLVHLLLGVERTTGLVEIPISGDPLKTLWVARLLCMYLYRNKTYDNITLKVDSDYGPQNPDRYYYYEHQKQVIPPSQVAHSKEHLQATRDFFQIPTTQPLSMILYQAPSSKERPLYRNPIDVPVDRRIEELARKRQPLVYLYQISQGSLAILDDQKYEVPVHFPESPYGTYWFLQDLQTGGSITDWFREYQLAKQAYLELKKSLPQLTGCIV